MQSLESFPANEKKMRTKNVNQKCERKRRKKRNQQTTEWGICNA